MPKTHFSKPGEILMREFLEPYRLSVNAAAKAMQMPRSRLNQIVRGERGISADTALRLGKFLGNSAEFWMNLQSHYDLAVTQKIARHALKKILSVQTISTTGIH